MILDYLLRLALLLPLVGALAWGSLWLWKRLQIGMPVAQTRDQLIRIAELRPIGAGTKLAVVEFGGKQLLVAISRTGVTSLAIDDREEFDAP